MFDIVWVVYGTPLNCKATTSEIALERIQFFIVKFDMYKTLQQCSDVTILDFVMVLVVVGKMFVNI